MLPWNARKTGCLVATAIAIAASGCGGGREAADDGDDAAAPPPSVPTPRPVTPELNDAEILHITVTANALDAEIGALARSSSETPRVLAYAAVMVADHTAIGDEAKRLATQLSVTPVEHDISRQLRQRAEGTRAALDSVSGPAFDRTYVISEIEYHSALLETLDRRLIATAQNPQLKAFLENVRPAIVAHLERARQIATAMSF